MHLLILCDDVCVVQLHFDTGNLLGSGAQGKVYKVLIAKIP